MKTGAQMLGVLAGGLLAIGLVLGFRTIHDDFGNVCGSAFRDGWNPYLGASNCDAVRSSAQPLALVLIGLAVTAAIATAIVAANYRASRRTPAAA